jgi:hypothetical protein
MKMLFIDVPLSISDVNSWPAPGNNLHQESITLLMKLKIFENAPLTSTQHSGIRMNPLYQTHLKILICGGSVCHPIINITLCIIEVNLFLLVATQLEINIQEILII